MESITSIDVNFSNAGGGHSASIACVKGAKKVQTGEDLGVVIGDRGEINSFSNEDVQKLMNNFICTETTTSSNANKTTIVRKYRDTTSLLLDSIVVLLRGVNTGPRQELDFMGEVPYFSEVINAPHPLKDSEGREFPFPSLEPERDGSVIKAGRIYNYESAAEFNGVKISLCYNKRQFKPELSLNDEVVSDSYKVDPDLSQYDLKYGYTLSDFHKIVELAGITIDWGEGGTPEDDNCLFETNGNLGSVIGNVASYFGYHWFINPENGNIMMINTQAAAALTPLDYTNTSDPTIVSATYTESAIGSEIVNTYAGSTDKPDNKSPKDDDRPRRVFFKRYFIDEDIVEGLPKEEMGAFFAIFNQGEDTDSFDKFTYQLLYMIEYSPTFLDVFGRKLLYTQFYKYLPYRRQTYKWGPKDPAQAVDFANWDFIYMSERLAKNKDRRISNIKENNKPLDRFKDKFEYILCNWRKTHKMPKPSQSDLYTYLQAYFAIAGGIYISNGYSKYKVERMEFQNMNNITIVGPLHKDTLISDIPDLSELWDVLTLAMVRNRTTVEDIWRASKGRKPMPKRAQEGSTPVNPYMFIAIRNIPKLERKNGQEADNLVDFRPLKTLEYYESNARPKKLWLGGESGRKKMKVEEGIKLSHENFIEALDMKKSLPIEYIRRKTRVNQIHGGEEAEEEEDNDIADSSESSQKMSDLFDRFDYKYFGVEKPDFKITNKLSISSASGSATEMLALKNLRRNYSSGNRPPVASSRTIYGLIIPKFTPIMSSLSISKSQGGVQVTVSESTINLTPPSQNFMTNKAQESIITRSGFASFLSAAQKNVFKLR